MELKLANHFFNSGINVITDNSNADVQLSFIQSNYKHDTIVQRLDGIYFNSEQDWVLLNQPIKSTYDKSAAVIYQSEFNKTLTEKYFGVHPNGTVIHNGTDVDAISKIQPLQHGMLDGFDKVWCCASSWRPHKRLKENVLYFLEHSSEKDCLVIAGSNPDFEIKNNRVFYVGNLDWVNLISLYKRSSFFLHLALMDHCPNVVVDARAAGCQIICTDSGGTKEVAGENSVIIKDMEWDLSPFKLYEPPKLDFSLRRNNTFSNTIDIEQVSKKYIQLFRTLL